MHIYHVHMFDIVSASFVNQHKILLTNESEGLGGRGRGREGGEKEVGWRGREGGRREAAKCIVLSFQNAQKKNISRICFAMKRM